jgi:spermidine/putrescine transport system substrate-binding protein
MKRFSKPTVIVLAAALLLSLCFSLAACNKAKADKFVIYNWEEYISEEVKDGFKAYYKAQTGKDIEIEYSTFDTNETMLTKIINNDAKVDVICPSEYAIEKLLQKGLLAPLDFGVISNYENVDPMITGKIDEVFGEIDLPEGKVNMNDYFVPYMWGTLGILYNTETVREEDLAKGWGLLWNQAGNPALEGKILMKDSIRDAVAATVFYLKENDRLPEGLKDKSAQELINTVNAELLAVIEQALKEQKPHLKGYEVDFGKDDMLNGIAYADLAWSGDAFWAIMEGENLNYFIPDSGSNIWFDGWVIPKSSNNKDAAMHWINYLCDPEIAMRNMMEIGYTAGVAPEKLQESESAIAILTDNDFDAQEFFADTLRYPIETEHLGVMKDLGASNEQAVDMWERVKAAGRGPQTWVIVLSVLGGVGIIGGAIAFYLTSKRRRRSVFARPVLAKMQTNEAPAPQNEEEAKVIDMKEKEASKDNSEGKDGE